MVEVLDNVKHHNIINDQNRFPEVKVYKYIISIQNEITNEEKLYKKAEYKYILVKKIERLLKESSIDCPINYNGNIFKEELEKYKNCEEINFNKSQDFNKLCQ